MDEPQGPQKLNAKGINPGPPSEVLSHPRKKQKTVVQKFKIYRYDLVIDSCV
jgi:hypothetical protein